MVRLGSALRALSLISINPSGSVREVRGAFLPNTLSLSFTPSPVPRTVTLSSTVKLVSAGVPLMYYHDYHSSISVTALTTNFKTTTYARSGFSESLSTVFNNSYTNSVRAMTKSVIALFRSRLKN